MTGARPRNIIPAESPNAALRTRRAVNRNFCARYLRRGRGRLFSGVTKWFNAVLRAPVDLCHVGIT